MLARITRPDSTMAAAVSSQEVSMPRIRVGVSRLDFVSMFVHQSNYRDHQIIRVICQDFYLTIRADPKGVLDSHSEPTLRIIKTWFNRHDDPGRKHVQAGGVESKPGQFVHMQTNAVSQSMDISLQGCRIAPDCRVTSRFEEFTGFLLVLAARSIDFEFADNLPVHRKNILVNGLDFIRGVAQTPCAGKIVEISTTCLARKYVEDDGFTKLEHRV
jgi:hypothetical protein